MAFLQTSVTEIIKAFEIAKKLYDSFTDEFDSAENRLQELRETFDFLSVTFKDYNALLKESGRTYPAQESLLRKLKELESFLKTYSAVVPEQRNQTVHSKARRVWQTARFTFSDHLIRLNDGLKMELQKLTASMVQLALRGSVPASDNNTIKEFVTNLLRLKNRHEREMSQAAIHGRQPNVRTIEHDVEETMKQLCHDVGLGESYLPVVSGKELLMSSSQTWNRAVINSYHTTSHDPLRFDPGLFPRRRTLTSESRVEPLSSNTSVSGYSVSHTNASTTDTTPLILGKPSSEAPRLDYAPLIGSPALMKGTAKISVGKIGALSLHHWSLPDRGPLVQWTCQKEGMTVEHWILADSFPYINHSSLNLGGHLTVEFLQPYRIVIKNHGNITKDRILKAKYFFTDSGDRDRFQSDVRRKDLEQTFDISTVECDTSSKLTANETLTLWHGRYDDKPCSISFFINTDPQRHVEFLIRLFQGKIDTDPRNQVVVLRFARPGKSSKTPRTPSSPGRKPSLFSRKLSFGLADSHLPLTQSRSHRHSVGTSASSQSNSDEQAYAPQEYIKKYGQFKIKFGNDKDFDDFVRKFKKAHDALPTPLLRTTSLSPSISTSPQGLDSMFRPELDSHPIEARPPDPVELDGESSIRHALSSSPSRTAPRPAPRYPPHLEVNYFGGRQPTSP